MTRLPARRPTVALALGGGAARGIAHIPLLEALDDLGVRPTVIAGTSIGAIVGVCYASGMSGRELRDYARGLFVNRTDLIRRMASRWPGSVASLWNPMTPAIVNGETLIEILLPDGVPTTFEALKIPFKTVATDLWGRSQVVLDKGPLMPAVAASASVPALLKPVQINGRVLVDGGCVNPTPFDVIRGSADVTVAFDLTSETPVEGEGVPSSLDAVMASAQIMFSSIVREKLRNEAPDILIRPEVGHFRALNFFKVDDLLAAAGPAKEELKRRLGKALAG
jgi:NTE family protein